MKIINKTNDKRLDKVCDSISDFLNKNGFVLEKKVETCEYSKSKKAIRK
jgi:hypothetical protein